MNTFGIKVGKFRKEHGLSLRDLGLKAGTNQTTIQRIERGGMPSIPIFSNLVKVMKYDPAQALRDVLRER